MILQYFVPYYLPKLHDVAYHISNDAYFPSCSSIVPKLFNHFFHRGIFLGTRPHAAAAFRRVLVMPNLVPPVTTTEAALAYRERILLRLPKTIKEGDFVPLMTFLGHRHRQKHITLDLLVTLA